MTSVAIPIHHRSIDTRLDELLDRSHGELRALYERASVPRIDSIKGDLRGRMLAVVVVPKRVRKVLRAFSGSRFFPWLGKSFAPHGIDRGEGINRIFSDRLRLFRFETSIAPSRAGDFDAVQLDYDISSNPKIIRMVKDEIRELRPGLFLGQAYLQTLKDAHLVLWFGLEA